MSALFLSWLLFGNEPDAVTPIHLNSVVIVSIDDVDVAANDGGLLAQTAVREGDVVHRGDLLGELDHDDQKLEVERAARELRIAEFEADNQLRVELAQKALGVAEAEFKRAVQANENFKSTVTQTELDRLRLTRDQAYLSVEQALRDLQLAGLRVELKRTELEIAEQRLARRRILAPIDGVVVKVHRHAGEWIQPGEAFCQVIRTDRVRAEGLVDVRHSVVSGQRVRIELHGPARSRREFFGEVTFVDPHVSALTGQYRIHAVIDNRNGVLRPGQSVAMFLDSVPDDGQSDASLPNQRGTGAGASEAEPE